MDVKLRVYAQGGEDHEIEAPLDMTVKEFIADLGAALDLPANDAEGLPVIWRLYNKDTGRILDPLKSLSNSGVEDGHRLSLIREVTAGCFSGDCPILLPSGETAPVKDVKPNDLILSFDFRSRTYQTEQVRGVYVETYSKQISIDGVLTTTPDQQLLLSSGQWILAGDLTLADTLFAFPYRVAPIASVEKKESLMPMYSITLPDQRCPVVGGVIARDYLGKQQQIGRAVDVFLSYSGADASEARQIYDSLEKAGLSVFMAEKSIEVGDVWEGVVKNALKVCREFWLLITPNAVNSEWVTTEWATAWALDKKILPILFRCKPEDLPLRLRSYQCIDLHNVPSVIATRRPLR